MGHDDDPPGVAAPQQGQRVLQRIAGDHHAFPVIGIAVESRRRGPGEVHTDAGKAEIVAHLRLTVQRFGEVGVEAVDEDGDLAVVRRPVGQRPVDRRQKGGVVAVAVGLQRQEIGRGVGRTVARESHAARLAVRGDRDHEAREAQIFRPPAREHLRIVRGQPGGGDIDRLGRSGWCRLGVQRDRAARRAACQGQKQQTDQPGQAHAVWSRWFTPPTIPRNWRRARPSPAPPRPALRDRRPAGCGRPGSR